METPIIWPGVWLISSSSAVPKSCLLACYLCQGAAGNTHQRTYHLSQNQCKITAVIGLEPGVFALGLLLPWFTRTLVYLGLHLPWCLRSSWFFFACLLLNLTEQKEQENVTGSPTWWADLKMFQNIYSNHLNTKHLNTGFIWIQDSMGVLYSYGKVTWLGRPLNTGNFGP